MPRDGAPIQEVSMQRAEVVLVNGNHLVIKLPEGSLRHLLNRPDTAGSFDVCTCALALMAMAKNAALSRPLYY